MADLTITQGELHPLEVQTNVDLTGGAVRLTIKRMVSGITKLAREAALIEETVGCARYTWEPGETDVPGDYIVAWQAVTASGEEFRVPSRGFIHLVIQPGQ